MLNFWQSSTEENPEMSLMDLLKKSGESADEIEVEYDETLGKMMAGLRDRHQLEPIENPPQLQATLREYQKRGVSWMQYGGQRCGKTPRKCRWHTAQGVDFSDVD